MAEFKPVDHDPFAGVKVTPVEGDPFAEAGVTVREVEGDPFNGTEKIDDDWLAVGRKVVENAPAMFKQSVAGQAQNIAERPPNLLSVLMPSVPGAPSAADALSILQKRGADWLREKLGMGPDESAAAAAKMYADATADLQENAPDVDPDSLKGYAYDAATSLIQMAPGVAASVATRRPMLGAGIMGGQVAGQQYGESRQEGRGPTEASADAMFYGVAEGIPEITPLGVLMKPGKKFFGRMLSTAGAEGLSEVMTQILQTGYDAGVLKEDMTWGEAVDAVKRAGILGVVTGGGAAAIAHPFVRDRGAGSTSTNVAPDAPAAPPGQPPAGVQASQDSGAATTPRGPWSPPAAEIGSTVGLKMGDRPPVRATIEGIQDGWVFWRDEDGNQQTDREDEFRRDVTAPPPARRGDQGKATEPSGVPTPPLPSEGDINDFDPWAAAEPKPRKPTEPSPQRSMDLPDTKKIQALRDAARATLTLAAEGQRNGQRTPEWVASMRVEAAKLMDEAAELERATTPRQDARDATAATPEQMAARGLGPLATAAPAASEATTGPQQFEVTPPKAPPAPAQGALAPVAGSEADNPQAPQFKPKAPEIPWQQRLRQRIAKRDARINDVETLAKQLGATPEEVRTELLGIASNPKAPIQQVRGTMTMDKKTGQVTRSKYAGTFRYAPKPSENAVEDLRDFVLSMGGIRPGTFSGELAARDLDKITVPFKGKIVNPNARLSFEQMAQAAMEAGFNVPTEAGTIYGQEQGLQRPGATSPNLDAFMEMLDQNANKVRRHFRIGDEPQAEGEAPATPQQRKAAALARLQMLGFEPKGTTHEELESQLDEYENAIGAFEPVDRLELHDYMEQENVDRLGDEARNALREETGDDFPHEYDAEWFAQEAGGPEAAALNEADGRNEARAGEAGIEPQSQERAEAGTRDSDAAATDADGQVETSRVDDTEQGDDSPAIDKSADLKKHIEDGGTPDTWVLEKGYQTSNEHAAVLVNGEPRYGFTSNNTMSVSWLAPPEIVNPGQNVQVTHNHPNESVGGDNAALSPADLQPLQMPGFTFITAITHEGKVSSAALTEAGENWLYPLTQDQSSEALMRLTGMAKRASLNLEPNDNLAQDIAMRILAHAGLVEYHTSHPAPASVSEGQLALAAGSIRRRMAENGFEAQLPTSETDLANRPTQHTGPGEALAAVQRRAKEVAARRDRAWLQPVGGPSDSGQGGGQNTSRISGDAGADRSASDGQRAPVTESTDQGEQYVLPGAERSDKQALAARASQERLKAKKPQKEPGGLFEKPTGTIAKLFADESGAVPIPDWGKIKSLFTRRGQPQTAQEIAREGLKVKLGNPDTLQSLSMPARWFRTAVSLASIDRPSAIYWNAILRRDHVKTTLEREAVEAVQPYLALDTQQRDRINKVLEHDRLFGIDRAPTGRTVVVKIPDRRPPFGERPELSKPGEIIALDKTETDALQSLRKFFDKRLMDMGEAAAIERGYKGAFNKRAIEDAIANAGNPQLRKIAQAALDIWNQMEDMRRTGYVPFQRYGDTYILIKPKANADNETTWFELVDTKSAFDKVFSRPGGKNRKPLDERVSELEKRFPRDQFDYDIQQATPKAIADINIPALEKAFASLNLRKDPGSKQVIDQLMTQIFQARKAGFKKKANNTPGYSLDFERAITDYVRQSSSIVAHLASRNDVDSAYETVQRHPVKEVRDYWESHQHHMEKEGGDWAPIRKYGFFMFLWGNPASAAVNLTQTPLVTQMQLGTWAGPRAVTLSHGALMEALGAVRVGKNGLEIDFDKVGKTDAEKALIRTLQREGRLDPVLGNEFRGFDRGRTKVRPHTTALAQMYEIGASMFNTTESANRIAAALAYFRAAQNPQLREKAAKVYAQDQNWREMVGRDPQPIDIARFGVDETQFIGGKLNRMPAMRGMGGAILQFKTYIANYLRLIHKNATRMGPQGKAAAAAMLIALIMVSGLAGLPFGDDVLGAADGILKLATGIDHNLEYQFRNWLDDAGFGEYGAEVLTRGFGRNVFGVDIGGRLGMGNIFPDNSFTSLAPVLTGTLGNAADAIERSKTGQPIAAAASVAPMFAGSGVGNLIKGMVQYPTEGASTKRGNWLVMPEDITTADMAIKSLGFQPTKISRKGEKEFMANRVANATKDARNAMLTNMARNIILEQKARAKGDKAAADKYQANIDALLAENAAQLLDPSIPDWQKIKPASRLGIRRRVQSLLAPDIARLKRSSKLSREELSDLPFVDEE